MKTDTPRTDERKASFALDTIRQLETELAAARAEIERLDTAGIHSCHKDCQRPNCVLRRELKAVTEQRDGLKQAVDCANDLLASVTEHQDKEREIYQKSYSAELARSNHYKQQRDRLAENLERALNATVLNHRRDRWHIDAEYTLQLIQSLTT